MKIKDSNGEYNVGSQAQATLNTVLGAVGTANALGNGLNLFGMGRGNRPPQDEGDRPVTRYEMGLILESVKKDTELAELRAKVHADEKVNDAERRQGDINREQAVYNGVNTATVQCIQKQVNMLLGMTQMVIPNGNVSPGWGGVTIEPTPIVKAATQNANNANGQ